MKKILLKGYYGFGNFGDDLLLLVVWKLIRKSHPRSDIRVFSNFNENLPGYNQSEGYNRYIHKLLGKEVGLLDWNSNEDFDLVINGGGGIYFDHRRGSSRTEIRNRMLRMLGASASRKIELILRKLVRRNERIRFKQRVGIGIGIGEFAYGAPSFFRKLSEIGSYSMLLVRDHHSILQLNNFGFDGEKGEYSDLVFLHEYWNDILPVKAKSKPDTIGLVLMDWDGDNDRFKKIREFERIITGKGYRVTYFSFDENYDNEFIRELRFVLH
ncbi:MAG: polysaccharide pyruvyl transferase family protein [Cyclobacteriaceae bacterium]